MAKSDSITFLAPVGATPAATASGRDAGVDARIELIEQLFRSLNDSLVRYLAAKLGSVAEAQELAQETYIRILKQESLDDIASLRAFAFRIASNLVVDRHRRLGADRRLKLLHPPSCEQNLQSPESAAAASEELLLLPRVLDELPAKCRQAFLLYSVEERGYSEIAATMGLTERMVRIYVQRAVAYSRSRISELSGNKE